MSDIEQLTNEITKFCKQRNWKQFHDPKDLALSLNLEAAEVLEHFQWKSGDELQKYIKEHKEHIGEELSDVLYWVLLMSHDLDIDIKKAFFKKMKKNAKKYPIKKAKNKKEKYNKI